MVPDITSSDSSVDRATGFYTQGCEFKPCKEQIFYLILFLFSIYNMKPKKLSKKFISREIKNFLPYP